MSAQLDLPAPHGRAHGLHAMTRALYEFSAQPELGILELARRIGSSVGMAQRIVLALVEAELVRQNPRTQKYALGHGVLRLSSAYSRHTGPVLERCLDELMRLVEQTGETAAVHRCIGRHRIVVAQIEGTHDLSWRSDIGRTYPIHAGAASKALLAFLALTERDAILSGQPFERFGPMTPGSRAELERQLADVQRTGLAVSFGERVAGAGGVAAPVFDAAGHCEYALSVYGPEGRIRPVVERISMVVLEAAIRASQSPFPLKVIEQ